MYHQAVMREEYVKTGDGGFGLLQHFVRPKPFHNTSNSPLSIKNWLHEDDESVKFLLADSPPECVPLSNVLSLQRTYLTQKATIRAGFQQLPSHTSTAWRDSA
jgi:hypothetical protein